MGRKWTLSSRNTQEYLRKMEKQRQRFGLRKLTVGVASVLLGTTILNNRHSKDGYYLDLL